MHDDNWAGRSLANHMTTAQRGVDSVESNLRLRRQVALRRQI